MLCVNSCRNICRHSTPRVWKPPFNFPPFQGGLDVRVPRASRPILCLYALCGGKSKVLARRPHHPGASTELHRPNPLRKGVTAGGGLLSCVRTSLVAAGGGLLSCVRTNLVAEGGGFLAKPHTVLTFRLTKNRLKNLLGNRTRQKTEQKKPVNDNKTYHPPLQYNPPFSDQSLR